VNPFALTSEALIATVGLFHEGPILRRDGKEAERLPKEWRKEIDDWLDQKAPRKFRAPKVPDYQKTLETLSHGWDVKDAAEFISELQNPDLGVAVRECAQRARGYLAERWPRLTLDGPLGITNLTPGWSELRSAAAVYEVVAKPTAFLREIRSETITKSQADAFRVCYPSLFEMITTFWWDGMRQRRAADKKYSLPWPKERVIRVVIGLPAAISLSRVAPQQKAPSGPPEVKADFSSQQSKAQQLAAR
jgi:hypothetical protein